MKIIFTGIHNKPGMLPLDGRTHTGQIIDKIIALLAHAPGRIFHQRYIKSNVYDAEIIVSEDATTTLTNWKQRTGYQPGDVVIALGFRVQKFFSQFEEISPVVKLVHPGAIFGNENRKKYITESVRKIEIEL